MHDDSLSSNAADPFLAATHTFNASNDDVAAAKVFDRMLLQLAAAPISEATAPCHRGMRDVSEPGAVSVVGIGAADIADSNCASHARRGASLGNRSCPEHFVPVTEASLVKDEQDHQVLAMKRQIQEMEKELAAMRTTVANAQIPVVAQAVTLDTAKKPETKSSYSYDTTLTEEENFAMEMLLGVGSKVSRQERRPRRSRSVGLGPFKF